MNHQDLRPMYRQQSQWVLNIRVLQPQSCQKGCVQPVLKWESHACVGAHAREGEPEEFPNRYAPTSLLDVVRLRREVPFPWQSEEGRVYFLAVNRLAWWAN